MNALRDVLGAYTTRQRKTHQRLEARIDFLQEQRFAGCMECDCAHADDACDFCDVNLCDECLFYCKCGSLCFCLDCAQDHLKGCAGCGQFYCSECEGELEACSDTQ